MPQIDIHAMMRRASEIDRDELLRRTQIARRRLAQTVAHPALLVTPGWPDDLRLHAPIPLAPVLLEQRAQATLVWVRTTCEREGYPDWLTTEVVEQAQVALANNDFPLLPEPEARRSHAD